MLYNVLLSVTVFLFCLSLLLVYRVTVLENDIHNLRRDINPPLNLPRTEQVGGKMAKMSKPRESCAAANAQSPLKMSFKRLKRDQGSSRAVASFLQLTASSIKQLETKGNIAVIPWTVSVQHGKAITQKENRIVVQEDGYYLVFGQVLFKSPSIVMGHIIQSWGHAGAAATSTELLRCLQEMPGETPTNTCYTAGIVQLHQGDELELVIPFRPQALISMDADSTFFGVIQLN
ncbi:tumor necrosis factor ligand superfamily member 13B-like isoform X2 [Takifugu rubripes]|uniref:tumor necrosis factor ligand superfamily member 13B-like isoform X2 n=1 Tax=Takifugu rubripes TaxID=31033 RepID=UPI0011455D17|nr:tumor necrosis factor ligand superfamily member 13B-like isoform X2 [Takifugu rubripes]